MTRGITQNHWRFHEPEAPNLEYGCQPNKKVFVKLRQELTQGVRPFDSVVTDSNLIQAGYFCNYIIDIPVSEGLTHAEEDGRGFWYVPAKNFVGTDKLSYRIINVMNQTSEPGCITFYVDHEQKPERIERIPELIKTTILQDGDADYWVETNEERKAITTRSVYAYNTVPDENYALIVTGHWRAKFISWSTWYGRPYPVENIYSGIIPLTVLSTHRVVDFADYDSLEFSQAIDDETIGLPLNWPLQTSDGIYDLFDAVATVGIKLVPIGDNRATAESSNLLVFTNEDYSTFPREISDKTRERLADKSTFFAKLSPEIKKPILLINGMESIAMTRPTKTGRLISAEGLTFDPAKDKGLLAPVIEQSYFDPVYNSATVDTIRNKSVNFEYKGFAAETKVVSLTFSLSDVPAAGGTFALVADIPDLTGAYTIAGFAPVFLDRDVDNKFVASTTLEYKGLLVLEVFDCPSSEILQTSQFNITRKFCANAEYINSKTTCLDAHNNIEFYPVELSKIRGFVFVPFSNPAKGQVANQKLLSSSYIPITTSATNVYPKICATTKQVAFYGAPDYGILPAINFPKEFLKWDIVPKICPDIVLGATIDNDAKLKIRWRLVPVLSAIADDKELAEVCEAHRKTKAAGWELDREFRNHNTIAIYENMVFGAKPLHKSAYPEIVSIRRLTNFDKEGFDNDKNSTTEFVAVLDLERTGSDFLEHQIEFFTHDAIANVSINFSINTFDTPKKNLSIAYAYVSVVNKVVVFRELQKAIEFA